MAHADIREIPSAQREMIRIANVLANSMRLPMEPELPYSVIAPGLAQKIKGEG